MTRTGTRTLHSVLDLMAALIGAEDFDLEQAIDETEDWAEARRAAASDSAADEITGLVEHWMGSGLDRVQVALDGGRAVMIVTPDAALNFSWPDGALEPAEAGPVRLLLDQLLSGDTLDASSLIAGGGRLQ